MKKLIIGIAFLFIGFGILCAILNDMGISYAQVPLTYTNTATKFQIDRIEIAPVVKGCSATYSFISDTGEVVKTKTIYFSCKNFPGIANAVKWVTAQIGTAEGKVIPDLPDVTK